MIRDVVTSPGVVRAPASLLSKPSGPSSAEGSEIRDTAEIQAPAAPPVRKRFGAGALKAMAMQTASRVTLSMARVAGMLAPEMTLMHMLSSEFLTPSVASAARLGLIDQLPASPDEIAKKLDLDSEGVRRLLKACSAVGVVKEKEGRFERTRMGERLTTDHPDSLKPLAVMLTDPAHWQSWGQIDHTVKTGRPAAEAALGHANVFDHYALNPEEARRFDEGMTAITRMVAREVGNLYDFSDCRKVVDIGGSQGVLLSSILKAAPQARGVLFDLPHVVSNADGELARAGVLDRTDKVGGSFFDEVPPGADVYVMKNILHDWNDEKCVKILENIREAMPPGSRLLVLEALVDPSRPSPADFMNMHMMVMNQGKERSREEFSELFEQAGLSLRDTVPTAGPYHILEAVASQEG